MIFQVNGAGWPLGAVLVPAGTILDWDKPDHFTDRVPRGQIPINASPLDAEAWNSQQTAHAANKHLLGALDHQWIASITTALHRIPPEHFRGDFGRWFEFMMSCKWLGISLASFTAWWGPADTGEITRAWNAVEPKSGNAFFRELKAMERRP